MKNILSKISLLSLILFSTQLNGAEPTPAELLSQPSPDYPTQLKEKNNEGWVKLNYMVDKEGNALDIIVEDTLGDADFEEAAINAIKKQKHKPATYKTKPVSQNVSDLVIDFTLPQEGKDISKFNDSFSQAVTALNEKDLDAAKRIIEQLDNTNGYSLEELSSLEIAKAQLASHQGDIFQQLEHLNRAKVGDGKYLAPEIYINTLKSVIAISLKTSKFYDAFESYRELERMAPNDDMVSRLALTIGPVKKALNEGRPIQVRGTISERGYWVHTPLRNVFAFAAAEEGVNQIEPRCERKSQRFDVNIDNEWKIPNSWGYCTIVVYGKPGARFDLLEMSSLEEE